MAGGVVPALSRTVALIAAGILLGLPARAIDLKGTWTGSQRCKFYDGVQTKRTFDLTNQVLITQDASRLSVETPGGVGASYNGEVLADASKSSKGRAVLTECRTTPDLNGYSEQVYLTGTANEGSGRLRGESIFRSQLGEVGTCKWKLSRASDQDPEVAGCAPQE